MKPQGFRIIAACCYRIMESEVSSNIWCKFKTSMNGCREIGEDIRSEALSNVMYGATRCGAMPHQRLEFMDFCSLLPESGKIVGGWGRPDENIDPVKIGIASRAKAAVGTN